MMAGANEYRRLRHARAAAIFALLVTAAACAHTTGDDDRSSGRVDPLASYRVRYDVTELDLAKVETVTVARPYSSRRSASRDGAVISDRLTNEDGTWTWTGDAWQRLTAGRQLAAEDDRLLGSLELLVDEDLAIRRGESVVAGESCRLYRVRAPIGVPVTEAPSEDDYVDYCVHAGDVVLEERWTLAGTSVRTRRATKFEARPRISAGHFQATPVARLPAVAGREVEIEATADIEDDLAAKLDLGPEMRRDGATATVRLDPFGRPTTGTVIRFVRRGPTIATLEEIERDRVSLTDGTKVDTPLGSGARTSTLRLVSVIVPIDELTALIVRSPDPRLVSDVLDAVHLAGD